LIGYGFFYIIVVKEFLPVIIQDRMNRIVVGKDSAKPIQVSWVTFLIGLGLRDVMEVNRKPIGIFMQKPKPSIYERRALSENILSEMRKHRGIN
jgi:hypothetical protein